MITPRLTEQSKKLALENPWGLNPELLYYQYPTVVSLRHPVTHPVLNSYNTGKTRAAFLHLLVAFKIGNRMKLEAIIL